VAGIVVTYRCGEKVIPTAESLLRQVDRLIIVDNGADAPTAETLRALAARFPSIELILNRRNLGIAGGLNAGIRRALAARCDWVLTMDHDSVPDGDMVTRLLEGVERDPERERVGLAAPRYFDAATGVEGFYPAPGKGLRFRSLKFGPETEAIEPAWVISSGSLIRADVFAEIGFLDENLFMDYVDFDFCFRLVGSGRRIIVPRQARMTHSLGSGTVEHFLGRKMFVSRHSAERRYSMNRNRAYLTRAYAARCPSFVSLTLVQTLSEAVGILWFEEAPFRKLSMMMRGVADGLRGRLGPREFPPGGKP
jgi:rhamnosyltransferase